MILSTPGIDCIMGLSPCCIAYCPIISAVADMMGQYAMHTAPSYLLLQTCL